MLTLTLTLNLTRYAVRFDSGEQLKLNLLNVRPTAGEGGEGRAAAGGTEAADAGGREATLAGLSRLASSLPREAQQLEG